MTNNNNHHSRNLALPQQSYPGFEQYLPTSGLVAASRRTNTAHTAGHTRILPLDVKSDIERDAAPQPASRSAVWLRRRLHLDRDAIPRQGSGTNSTPTHTRPAKRDSEHAIFSTASSRTRALRPDTRFHTQASGHSSAGEAPKDPDNPIASQQPAQRPEEGVWQDKGVLTNASSASVQPAPDTKSIRVQLPNNGVVRSQNHSGARQKSGRLPLWGLDPALMSELERIAAQEGLSLSLLGKTALRQWVHLRLHDQHEALMYPVLRQLFRDELRAFGNRLVFFLMRIAFAAEQTRILTTNLLSRVLKHQGASDEVFTNLVDQSNKMARRNIIAKTPQLKSLMEEWWSGFPEDTIETPGKEAPHD